MFDLLTFLSLPSGHIVCEECRLRECTCKSKSFVGPLSHVEKVLDKLQWHYCCHYKHGCRDVIEAKRFDEHVKTCIFRDINCPDSNCKKQLIFKDIIDHIANDHEDWDNVATKVDGKTFVVSYGKDVIGVR